MSELEILNTEQHRTLRIRPDVSPRPHFVPIVASELTTAAACCPVLLAKNPDNGRFYLGAMFGFKPGENLVDEDVGASCAFRPLEIERRAFFVSGEDIAVDVEHPRISKTDGEPLFEDNGEPTEPMQRIQRALGLLVAGNEETEAFLKTMVDLRLVEPIDITLRFDDGETLHLEGLYTVSLDSIADLSDEDALGLFRKGYLQFAYVISASLKQIPLLAHRRNQRLADGSLQ